MEGMQTECVPPSSGASRHQATWWRPASQICRRPEVAIRIAPAFLARFPFTDLSGDKRGPALVVSRDNDRRLDVIVCFITSVPRTGPDMAALPGTGLKVPSVVRFDKIATLDRSIITGKPGDAPPDWIAAQRATFFGVFGCDIP